MIDHVAGLVIRSHPSRLLLASRVTLVTQSSSSGRFGRFRRSSLARHDECLTNVLSQQLSRLLQILPLRPGGLARDDDLSFGVKTARDEPTQARFDGIRERR